VGKKIKRAIENVHGYGKFGQTTWNRLQGDGKKKRRRDETGGADDGGSAPEIVGAASEERDSSWDETEGALSDARDKRKKGTLVGEGPVVFSGYGTLGG
jgi:hypothetical protein